MNLELKHLAAYLPYYLELEIVNSVNKGYYLNGISKDTVIHVNHDNYLGFKCHIIDIKPILRPLSDIGLIIETDNEVECNYDLDYLISARKLHLLPYSIIEKLLEWHFDIFGLIDAGLAIDINTLKNNTDGSTLLQP